MEIYVHIWLNKLNHRINEVLLRIGGIKLYPHYINQKKDFWETQLFRDRESAFMEG